MGGLQKFSEFGTGSLSWPSALLAIFIVRAVVSFTAGPGSSHAGLRQYQLFSSPAPGNRVRHPQWNPEHPGGPAILDVAWNWLWLVGARPVNFVFHQFVLHTDVPDNSIADPILFLARGTVHGGSGNLSDSVMHPPPGCIACFPTFFFYCFSGAFFMLTRSFRTSICSPTRLATLCGLTSCTW